MKIESVDFFYLSMPEILDVGDGSQDALLVRIRAGEWEGWGECEASPLTSIAAWCCPRSHSACKPVRDSVLGQSLHDATDIMRIGNLVRENSLDLLQADHTLSGIDIALWDLLGRKLEAPIWQLLGYSKTHKKNPYASQLFGDSPQQTWEKACRSREQGYRAVKFGWGPFGRSNLQDDCDQLLAARDGLGSDGILLVDAGTVWGYDIEAASARLPMMNKCRVVWLEEPFRTGALSQYKALAAISDTVKIAGGEGSHNIDDARHMMEYGGVGFIQIDAGRVGGITPAKQIADEAGGYGISFVNHTFTSHLALSASLQPFAGIETDTICEYPVEARALAVEMTRTHINRDDNGEICAPESPGLGLVPDTEQLKKYLVPVDISVCGKTLHQTPEL